MNYVFEACKTCDHTFTDAEVHALCRAYAEKAMGEPVAQGV